MPKHHHKDKTEPVCNREQGVKPAPCEKMPSHPGESRESEDIQAKLLSDDKAIRLRAYEIHREKGGTALDNWLEAERESR